MDGVAAAERLRRSFPESYRVLSRTRVRYSDVSEDPLEPFQLHAEHTVIREEEGPIAGSALESGFDDSGHLESRQRAGGGGDSAGQDSTGAGATGCGGTGPQ